MAIYHRNSGFTHQKWWFSMVMLVYRRVIMTICAGTIQLFWVCWCGIDIKNGHSATHFRFCNVNHEDCSTHIGLNHQIVALAKRNMRHSPSQWSQGVWLHQLMSTISKCWFPEIVDTPKPLGFPVDNQIWMITWGTPKVRNLQMLGNLQKPGSCVDETALLEVRLGSTWGNVHRNHMTYPDVNHMEHICIIRKS